LGEPLLNGFALPSRRFAVFATHGPWMSALMVIKVLHNFIGGRDGADLEAGLILSGNTVYGTAGRGGQARFLCQHMPVARGGQTLQPLEQARQMELRREAESLGAFLDAQTVLQQEALGRFDS
jgi:hypothetical protein